MPTSPLRIALAITELEPGGAERQLVNLATHVAAERLEVRVICLSPPPAQRLLCDKLESAGIPVVFLNCRRPWQAPRATRALRTFLDEFRPQVLQSFLWHANLAGAWAARHFPGMHLVAGIRQTEPAHSRLWLEKWALKRAQCVVCVSQAVAEYSHAVGGLPRENLVVIPNGLPAQAFEPAAAADLTAAGIPPTAAVLLAVGRLERQKGFDRLLDSWTQIAGQLPHHHLVIVGAGSARAALGQQQTRCGAAGRRVHFLPPCNDLKPLFARAQLFVLSSRWEGMPNVLLEAMAAEKPVMACPAAGVAEVLGPLAEHQLVRGPNVGEGLARGLLALANDVRLREQLGRENRRRVQQEFALATMVARYENLWQSLASTPGTWE